MKVSIDIPEAELEKWVVPALAEPRILLHAVSWDHYETVLSIMGDRPNLRLTYLEGSLEIMTLSPRHEQLKAMLTRLLIAYSEEIGVDLYSCGSTVYRSEAGSQGVEADESFCLGHRKDRPDIALEIVTTEGGLDRISAYQGLGIQEIWLWKAGEITIYYLQDSETYSKLICSEFFPDLDLDLFASFMKPESEPQAVRAFRQAIREV